MKVGSDTAASVLYTLGQTNGEMNVSFEFQARPNKAEIGWGEAKVLGDLPVGISPTAPRS